MAPKQPETGRVAGVQLSQKLARVDAVPRVLAIEPRDEGRPVVLGICQKYKEAGGVPVAQRFAETGFASPKESRRCVRRFVTPGVVVAIGTNHPVVFPNRAADAPSMQGVVNG